MSDPTPPTDTANLHTALTTLGLVRSTIDVMFPENRTTSASTSARRCYALEAEPMELAFRGYHHFRAHGIILDEITGTLGIIHRLEKMETTEPTKVPTAEPPPRDAVRNMIEEAAYIRHLLLQETSPHHGGRDWEERTYFVEVTLVVADWDRSAEMVGAVLREIMQTASFLHTIGVSLLDSRQHANEAAMRRAFPWLMKATRQWYQTQKSFEATANQPARQLAELRLSNFRCAGDRTWTFVKPESNDPRPTLHLVHGQNGSGKSTLTEAFELLVTGKIRRLGQGVDYPKVLRNRTAELKDELKLAARFEQDQALHDAAFTPSGLSNPLDATFSADAFCLDENLSNRLSRGTPAERAHVFLSSLLKEEAQPLDDQSRAHEAWQKHLSELPAAARQVMAKGIPLMGDVTDEEAALTFLGSNIGELGCFFPALASQPPGPNEFGAASAPIALNYFKRADVKKVWSDLYKNAAQRLADWKSAHAFLQQLNGWNAGDAKEVKQSDVVPLVQEIEELTALIDLLERECVVTETLAVAQEKHGYQDAGRYFCGAGERTSQRASDQKAQLAQSKERLKEVTLALQSAGTSSTGGEQRPRPVLPSALVPVLNHIGEVLQLRWEASEWLEMPLGKGIGEVLSQRRPRFISSERLGRMTVGRPDTLGSLLEYMQPIKEALEELVVHPDDYPTSLKTFADSFERLMVADDQRKRLEKQSVEAFQQKIQGHLAHALNELTALMTPARWAYQDLAASVQLGESRAMNLNIGDVPAALTLNTAELNTMTLALFLLCGIKTANPLRLIVLDDPFQNMDELSVTTVARGLSRLMRLWDDHAPAHDWRIVLMLHGEENVERVRSEAPCAVYHLPWLTPLLPQSPKEIPLIIKERSRMGAGLIQLKNAITPSTFAGDSDK